MTSAAVHAPGRPRKTLKQRPVDAQRLNAVLNHSFESMAAPFFVGMVATKDGVIYEGCAGHASRGLRADADTVMRAYSMTKAIASAAALILVDRGELSMDAPVESVLPEFSKVKMLEGWDGQTPILREPRVKATVKHLATHTAGLEYEIWQPDVARFLQTTKLPSVMSGKQRSLFYPMTTEPGSQWGYGISIDWLGRVIEAVSGLRIDKFLKRELLGPLGMVDTDVELRPHMRSRLASAFRRSADDVFEAIDLQLPSSPEFYAMGHALYTTPRDYMRFLRMVLSRGSLEGTRVLSETAVDLMLTNQIGELQVRKLPSTAPKASVDVDIFPTIAKSHTIGFFRTEQDLPGMRRAGSLFWAGALNTHYWIDPTSDIAGLLMTQTRPFAEPPFMEALEAFEWAVYN